jgi:MFS transporter, CP family, cyanate transporter
VLLALNLRIAVGEIPPVLRDLPLGDFGRSLLVTIPLICFSLAAFAGPPCARLGEERGLLLVCAALCTGLALRPWWPSFSLFAGTILCGLAVAVMDAKALRVFQHHLRDGAFGVEPAFVEG